MKILYVITKGEEGGAQSVVSDLIHAHARRGDHVLLMTDKEGWLSKTVQGQYVQVVFSPFFSNTLNPITQLEAIFDVREIVKQFQPDIVSTHSFAGGIVGRWGSVGLAPSIHTFHGVSFTDGTPFWRKVVSIIAEGLTGLISKKMIAVSENDRKTVVRYLPFFSRKIVTIHNGVALPPHQERKLSEKLRLVFVGTMEAPKNPFVLIRALSRLSEDVQKKFELTFIGDGSYKLRAEQMSSLLIPFVDTEFLGKISREEVENVLNQKDILVFTSHWEGFPMAILEAMARGLTIISSNVGGVSEMVDAKNGVLLSRENEEQSLADTFTAYATNPLLIFEQGKESRKKIEERFLLNQMCNNTFDCIDKIIEKSSKK
jgi:glycosyltransferase involved in cell wall biosynthesis